MALKDKFPRNITPELHAAWLDQRRKNDPRNMARALGVSKVTITKAFVCGHVTMDGLSDKITKYLQDRINEERKQAEKLNQSN